MHFEYANVTFSNQDIHRILILGIYELPKEVNGWMEYRKHIFRFRRWNIEHASNDTERL